MGISVVMDNSNVIINTNTHILDLRVFFPKSIIELIIITHIQVETPLRKWLIISLFKKVSIEKDIINITRNGKKQNPKTANTPPQKPLILFPINAIVFTMAAPGPHLPIVMASKTSSFVINFLFVTNSFSKIGIIVTRFPNIWIPIKLNK